MYGPAARRKPETETTNEVCCINVSDHIGGAFYVYAAMAFSVAVEGLNMLARRARQKHLVTSADQSGNPPRTG
jgi:uncharacterized membrane protein